MKCPECGCVDNGVVDSRLRNNETQRMRRRECGECWHRFNTVEIVSAQDLARALLMQKQDDE